MHMVERTRDWLRRNYILVNDDWLKACVEWIQEENQGHGLTDNDVNAQVYEQWLLADLHELETCCLPAEVVTAQKYELSGSYALQIDSIVDVGVSFYSQQQKLKGTENANVHVNADEPTQKPWEPKPSRMLMFKLTDGTHCVQGMEFRPISCLSPQTSPGAKILVHGNVLCRHGVLMLSDSNVRFLGGEVDTLVEANTVLNTLQSAMEASEMHSGKDHKQTYSGSEIRQNKQPVTANSLYQGNQLNSWTRSQNSNTSNQISQIRSRDVKPPEKIKVEPVSQNCGNNAVNNRIEADFDGFPDDDMEGLMEEMDVQDFQSLPTQIPNSNRDNSTNKGNLSVNSSNNRNGQSKQCDIKPSADRVITGMVGRNSYDLSSHIAATVSGSNDNVPMDDLDAMDFEDDMDFPPLDDDFMASTNTQTNIGVAMELKDTIDNESLNNNKTASKKTTPYTSSGNSGGKIFKCYKEQNSNRDDGPKDSDIYNPGIRSSDNSSSNKGEGNRSREGMAVTCNKSDTSKTSVTMSVNGKKGKTKLGLTKVKMEGTDKSIADNSGAPSDNSGAPFTNSSAPFTNSSAPFTYSSAPFTNSSAPSIQIHKVQQMTLENFLTPNKPLKQRPADVPESKRDIQIEYPFTYLAKLMSVPAPEKPSYHTVKAFISTLTSRLTTVEGKWTLTCKINDGTMAVDVDLSNQVLTQMIGFSPKEAQVEKLAYSAISKENHIEMLWRFIFMHPKLVEEEEMKLRVKTDPSVKEVLQEGIQQCQQKLVELMCLLELEICVHNIRPVIVATKQLTPSHIHVLLNRVLAARNDSNTDNTSTNKQRSLQS